MHSPPRAARSSPREGWHSHSAWLHLPRVEVPVGFRYRPQATRPPHPRAITHSFRSSRRRRPRGGWRDPDEPADGRSSFTPQRPRDRPPVEPARRDPLPPGGVRLERSSGPTGLTNLVSRDRSCLAGPATAMTCHRGPLRTRNEERFARVELGAHALGRRDRSVLCARRGPSLRSVIRVRRPLSQDRITRPLGTSRGAWIVLS